MLLSYLRSIKTANKLGHIQSNFGFVIDFLHLAIWIGVAVAYRVAKNGKDLWGWACSPLANKIQPSFEGVVNFHNVCSRSVSRACFIADEKQY
jgi:hypothetical protein